MPSRGLIDWLAVPRGLDLAKGLLFLSVVLLPLMVIAAPGGVITSDLCLVIGCIAGAIGLRVAERRLAIPHWGLWAAAIIFPYAVSMLFGRDVWILREYPIALIQHLYAPCFALLLVLGAQNLWFGQAETVLCRALALSGLFVVLMDLAIAVLAMSGLYVFAPAFRDGFYPSRLDWPFARPSQLPGFLLASFPLTMLWLHDAVARRSGVALAALVTLLGTLAHLLVATMSGSRAGFVGVLLEGVGVMGLILLRTPRRRWPIQLGILVGGALTAVSGLVILGQSNWVVRRSLLVFSDALSGSSLVGMDFRAHNWEFAQRLILSEPLFGGGLTSGFAQYGYEIHNTYLAAFAEMGAISGVAVLILLIGLPAYALVQWFSAASSSEGGRWIPGLFLAMAGSASFAASHYVLRQRWIWLLVVLMLVALSELRKAQVNTPCET